MGYASTTLFDCILVEIGIGFHTFLFHKPLFWKTGVTLEENSFFRNILRWLGFLFKKTKIRDFFLADVVRF